MNYNIIDSNQEYKQERIEFSYNILGPIFYHWCLKLYWYSLAFSSQKSCLLFCTRAGFRLKQLFDIFLKNQQINIEAIVGYKIFYISRFLVSKGIYLRDPDKSIELITQEFSHTNVFNMLLALQGDLELVDEVDYGSLKVENVTRYWVNQILMSKEPKFEAFQQHFREQAAIFEEYLNLIGQGYETLLLVDSGWQGTTQKLLHYSFPEWNWYGLYFGRMKSSPTTDTSLFHNVNGLMFECDGASYDEFQPLTSIYYHRHLIEDLLEPNVCSVESLKKYNTKIVPFIDEIIQNANLIEPDDHHFFGIIKYFQEQNTCLSVPEIVEQSEQASKKLAKLITEPTIDDAHILNVGNRSANFGKKETNPVLIFDQSLSQEYRIKRALWLQGQLVCENLLDEITKYIPQKKITLLKKENEPLVGIITRTKNRNIFLERAAESVASQTIDDYVWIVVNDGGDPELVEQTIIKSQVDLSKVKVIHNKTSQGMESASNIGIKASNSKYLVIHDDDDSWLPLFLENTVSYLEAPPYETIKGVIAHANRIDEVIVNNEYVEIIEQQPYMEWVKTIPIFEMLSANLFAPISFVYTRKALETVGLYDESLPVLGDWDFNIRFLMNFDIGVISKKLANYHHRTSILNSSYANSIYGDLDKHMFFDTIVRNKYLRYNENSSQVNDHLVTAYCLARILHEIRGILHQKL
jgi:glycosyltransferase involved in cell wall biosynthesis